jgi:hypothetical protein
MEDVPTTESVAQTVAALRDKGVRLWADGGRLRYQSLPGMLTPEEIQRLRALKARIVAYLQQHPPTEAPGSSVALRQRSDRAPLTFSQQWYWRRFAQGGAKGTPRIAAAIRLTGRLNLHALRASFAELVHRHETLRTRIVAVDGALWQRIDVNDDYVLEVTELTDLPEGEREPSARKLIGALAARSEPLDVGPLFSAHLLKLADEDHVLMVALDHMISDGASIGVVWREIFAMYAQSAAGQACKLPPVPFQFADYALWQQQTNAQWTAKHGAYWKERLAGAQRVRLSAGTSRSDDVSVKWAMLPIRFDRVLSGQLRELSRRERTSLVMSCLTAYAALMLRWCHKMDLVIPFPSLGRLLPEVENTIGFFGTPVMLRVQLQAQDSFTELLRRVTHEYAAAYEHNDAGRSVAQVPPPEFVGNPTFNWIPSEFNMRPVGQLVPAQAGRPVRMAQFPFADVQREDDSWDQELVLQISESGAEIVGDLWYRTDLFALATVERIARNFRMFADKLTQDPGALVAAISCEP